MCHSMDCALPAEPAPGLQLKHIAAETSGRIPIIVMIVHEFGIAKKKVH